MKLIASYEPSLQKPNRSVVTQHITINPARPRFKITTEAVLKAIDLHNNVAEDNVYFSVNDTWVKLKDLFPDGQKPPAAVASKVALPSTAIGKEIKHYPLPVQRHQGYRKRDGYATVTLNFWLDEKPQVATLQLKEPDQGESLKKAVVLEAVKKLPTLPGKFESTDSSRVFIKTGHKIQDQSLGHASHPAFKRIDEEAISSKDGKYDLLLLAGTVSRSWKPEARAGRSRTGTRLCTNCS
eukprot:GHVU01146609.1.p1 GENE.GHVU01146609.1~~GHVU01146609.1.p1  ORF type:complete len:239 (-),score=18.35 GHVU01146609.1:17-733(-)